MAYRMWFPQQLAFVCRWSGIQRSSSFFLALTVKFCLVYTEKSMHPALVCVLKLCGADKRSRHFRTLSFHQIKSDRRVNERPTEKLTKHYYFVSVCICMYYVFVYIYGVYGTHKMCTQNCCRNPECKRSLGRCKHRWYKILKWVVSRLWGCGLAGMTEHAVHWQAVPNTLLKYGCVLGRCAV